MNAFKPQKIGALVKNNTSSTMSLCTVYFPDQPDAYTSTEFQDFRKNLKCNKSIKILAISK